MRFYDVQGQGSATSTHGLTADTKGFSRSICRTTLKQATVDPRLDTYPSIRRDKSYREKKKTTNMGPGSYDVDITKRPPSPSISVSSVPPGQSIVIRSFAPPVGTYDIPRIMSPNVIGSELGTQVTSSFRSSGRKKNLMMDGVHFATCREDIKLSNLGPGCYDTTNTWDPKFMTKMKTGQLFRPVTPLRPATAPYPTPWKDYVSDNSTNKNDASNNTTGNLPKVRSSKIRQGSTPNRLNTTPDKFTSAEVQNEINMVRSLPDYDV